jgi:hypothetical protein
MTTPLSQRDAQARGVTHVPTGGDRQTRTGRPHVIDRSVIAMSTKPDPSTEATQPEPEASSDGDGSWTDDPQTQDPDEDRSVEAVIRRTAHPEQ